MKVGGSEKRTETQAENVNGERATQREHNEQEKLF